MRISMSSKTSHGHETYTVDPYRYDSNLNIATKKYTVDLCVKDSNLNIATRHTMWIYATVHRIYSNATWICQKISRVFISTTLQYESNHVNTCVEVEHGRNHLITGHQCIPLTSVREITINVNDSQGTLVQSNECELMS